MRQKPRSDTTNGQALPDASPAGTRRSRAQGAAIERARLPDGERSVRRRRHDGRSRARIRGAACGPFRRDLGDYSVGPVSLSLKLRSIQPSYSTLRPSTITAVDTPVVDVTSPDRPSGHDML